MSTLMSRPGLVHLSWIQKWFTPCQAIKINHAARLWHTGLSSALQLFLNPVRRGFESAVGDMMFIIVTYLL